MASTTSKAPEPNAMPTMLLCHQEDINRFSRLNTSKKELEETQKRLKREIEDIEEAGNEVMLMDDEGGVPYGIGDCFVRLTGEEVEVRLEELTAKKEGELEDISSKLEKIRAEMAVLKKDLYAQFGNALYLEEE